MCASGSSESMDRAAGLPGELPTLVATAHNSGIRVPARRKVQHRFFVVGPYSEAASEHSAGGPGLSEHVYINCARALNWDSVAAPSETPNRLRPSPRANPACTYRRATGHGQASPKLLRTMGPSLRNAHTSRWRPEDFPIACWIRSPANKADRPLGSRGGLVAATDVPVPSATAGGTPQHGPPGRHGVRGVRD